MSTVAQSAKQNKVTPASAGSSLLVQRKCACGGASKLTGQCSECEQKKLLGGNAPSIQAKLKIGPSNDKYEQEADRVADEVMRMPDESVQRQVKPGEEKGVIQRKPITRGITALMQRQASYARSKSNEERAQNHQMLADQRSKSIAIAGLKSQESAPFVETEKAIITIQRKEANSSAKDSADMSMVQEVTRSAGQELDSTTRGFMEQRFGHDFSRVKIHDYSKAAASANLLSARAYTLGKDIVFAAGQYSPDTRSGRQLLAHELTHVIQQGSAHNHTDGKVVQRAPPSNSADAAKKGVPPRVFKMGESSRVGNQSLNLDIDVSGRARVVPVGSQGGASLRESWQEAFIEEFSIQLNTTTLAGRDTGEILSALNYLRGRDWEIKMIGDPELNATYVFETTSVYEEAAKAERLAAIEATLRTQNPEQSERYKTQEIEKPEPKKNVTDFRCNTFATDFVDIIANTAGVFNAYLPKVWWSHPRGVTNQSTQDLDLEKTFAQAPQSLNKWLQVWGGDYGWIEITDGDNAGKIAQEKANQGILVIFSLTNHIGLIVAETSTVSARRVAEKVTRPVIAQAGVTKIKRGQKLSALTFEDTWLYYYDSSRDKSLGGAVVRR